MANQELQSRKRARQKRLQTILLNTVAAAGLMSVALVAPNVIGALGKLGYLPTRGQRQSVSRARDRLIEKGLVRYEGKFLRVTPRGEKVLMQARLSDYQLRKPRQWDGKWRILIFDIPEKRRSTREKVRRTLRSIGFERLQDSVWAYPYDCEEFITLLKADFKIGKDILYLIADSVEYDRGLRKRFNLS